MIKLHRKAPAAPEETAAALPAESPAPEATPLNHEQEEILQWFKTVKFRGVLVGGVDEADVWKKLDELNRLYDASLAAERTRYDTLLAAYQQSAAARLNHSRQALEESRRRYEELEQAYNALKYPYRKRAGNV